MPFIELRPLTILVGRNSAGKSTFLRSLPLLRQSIETKASAPVLWWGDYVDFGNFESAANNRDTSKTISFEFKITDFKYVAGRFRNMSVHRRNDFQHVDVVEIRHGLCQFEGVTVRDFIEVKSSLFEESLKVNFGYSEFFVSNVSIGDVNISKFIKGHELVFESEDLFDTFYFVKTKSKDDNFLSTISRYEIFVSLIIDLLKENSNRNISYERYFNEARKILSYQSIELKTVEQLMDSEVIAFRKIYKSIKDGKNRNFLKEINTICKTNHLLDLLENSSRHLSDLFSQVEYIGPARARSERYYRQQELQVADISPDGTNLPIFLASLNGWELDEFSNWVAKRFGYGVDIDKDGAHITINLIQNGQKINVIDTGYGVSQVLPVLAQIWWMRQLRRKFRRSSTNRALLAIEQPELHLHPAHQALLAEAFLDSLVEDDERANPITLIVETHSESLINRIGELISDDQIKRDQVQIVVFGSGDAGCESIEIATYDSNGMLDNWPHGFFNY